MPHPFRVLNVGAAALAMFVLRGTRLRRSTAHVRRVVRQRCRSTAVLARVAVPQLQRRDRTNQPRAARSSSSIRRATVRWSINKSIKVIGPSGVYGGISVLGGGANPTTGIVINAAATDVIIAARPRHQRCARRGRAAPQHRHRHSERRYRAHREVVDQQFHAAHQCVHQRRTLGAGFRLRRRQLPARVPDRHQRQRDGGAYAR